MLCLKHQKTDNETDNGAADIDQRWGMPFGRLPLIDKNNCK